MSNWIWEHIWLPIVVGLISIVGGLIVASGKLFSQNVYDKITSLREAMGMFEDAMKLIKEDITTMNTLIREVSESYTSLSRMVATELLTREEVSRLNYGQKEENKIAIDRRISGLAGEISEMETRLMRLLGDNLKLVRKSTDEIKERVVALEEQIKEREEDERRKGK